MGVAFLHGNGGSGGGLNFRVIGGTSVPSNPKDNDIWVNTKYKITGYIFSVTEPEPLISDKGVPVWIAVGTSSIVEFNAMKKNGLLVYPLFVKQYTGAKWENVNAMIYMGNGWVQFSSEWDGRLYNNGDQCTDHSGGWFGYPASNNYVVFNTDNIQFVNGDNTSSAATIYTNNAIDITGFKNLTIKGTVTNFDGNHIKFGITKSNDSGYNPTFEASTTVSNTGSMDATLDISNIPAGKYYIAVWSKYANFKITEIILS